MFRALLFARRLSRLLWVRVALFAVLAVCAVIGAHLLSGWIPRGLIDRFGPAAVIPVLSIIASSMLAVSTFSLGTMVAAHRAAGSAATPRVVQLMIADTTTQTVLGVFIGAFLYALTALILFHAGFDGGAPLVLGVTLLVVMGVVVALIAWIHHLTTLGTLGDALERVEAEGRAALKALRLRPALGATPLTAETVIADDAEAVPSPVSGVVQAIDIAGLATCVTGPVWVLKRPGEMVLKGAPLVRIVGPVDPAVIGRCFVIGHRQTYEQTPTLGLQVLSEIASRALSPGINDPGTAREVIARLTGLLWDWGQADHRTRIDHPTVFVPAVTQGDLVEAAFAPIARDGAGVIEVVLALLDALDALRSTPDPDLATAAERLRHRAVAYAREALTLPDERALLEDRPETHTNLS